MKLITNSTYLTFISLLIFSFGCLRNPEDCEGTQDGSAYIDKCGGCVGGITNLEACVDEDEDGNPDMNIEPQMRTTFYKNPPFESVALSIQNVIFENVVFDLDFAHRIPAFASPFPPALC